MPAYIRSDNGPEFVAQPVRDWITAVGAKTAFIEPGSPWENGHIESFNARFRDDPAPPDPDCDCPACTQHSRAYLRHLIKCGESLGARLATLHNLRFYLSLLERARRAIAEGRLASLHAEVEEISEERIGE